MSNKSTKKRLVLGITGNFGCGKTTVAGIFKKLGASCISADTIYHQLIKPKSSIYEKIVSTFGRDILRNNNRINRKKLGKIVFDSPEALKRLCQITHPAIIKRMRFKLSKLKKVRGSRVIVIEVPLLIEADLIKMFDKVVTVKINRKNQIARCRKQKGISGTEVIKRIKNQAPQAKKIKLADYVIDNNGTLKQTGKQVKDIWKKLSVKP